jgi:voltage-gated potassium channel
MAYSNLQAKIHEIIFEADTPAGKAFDVALLVLIILSVIATMLETVTSIEEEYGALLITFEWIVTIFFTIEYVLRIYISKKPWSYILSFYGIVDFISIIPTYFGILNPSTKSLAVIRSLRLFRIFRVLKLAKFLSAYESLNKSLSESKDKILVFLTMVVIIVFIVGSLMYVLEGKNGSGFDNIPISVYWAIVTVTTVGYGDIAPITPLGQFFASCLMIIGYAIIAIPTGIVGAGIVSSQLKADISTQVCHNCRKEDHHNGAKHCYNCGELLN